MGVDLGSFVRRLGFIFIIFSLSLTPALHAEQEAAGEIPGGDGGIEPGTDDAIKRGLDALAKMQNSDGSFGTNTYKGNVAVSALGGLAFVASGSSPGRGPYGGNIDKVVKYLIERTEGSGLIKGNDSQPPMYGHGFATLFLAEMFGMTHDKRIGDAVHKAVRLIIDTQNKEGGWRYQPVQGDSDLSITICQVNALRAARNAGIYVPKEVAEKTLEYVKKSQNPNGSFRYIPNSPQSTIPLTAAGLVSLFSVGDYKSDFVQRGLQYLRANPFNKKGASHYFYGLYYIVQARWIYGGDVWTEWFPGIQKELVSDQDKGRGVWKGDFVGEDYSTAMALLVLQAPNNYLPIFQR